FGGLAQILPASAVAAPDTNINDYALYAYEHLENKGGGHIGGNVGVRDAYVQNGSYNTSLGECNGKPLTMADGCQVAADTVNTTSDCSYYDLFANGVTGGSAPIVRHSQNTWTPPLPMTIPDPGPFSCGSNTSTIFSGAVTSVAPGTYGDANWGDGAN